jgi:hypothetical protein
MEVSGQLYAPVTLSPGKELPGTHRIGGWVGPRARLDAMAKRQIPSPCQELNPNCPAHSLVTILNKWSWLLSVPNTSFKVLQVLSGKLYHWERERERERERVSEWVSELSPYSFILIYLFHSICTYICAWSGPVFEQIMLSHKHETHSKC